MMRTLKKTIFPIRRGRDSDGVRFFIFGRQRTGTTLLTEYLDSSPQIKMHNELFINQVTSKNNSSALYLHDKTRPIHDYLSKTYNKGLEQHKACGFKLMLNQSKRHSEVLNELHRLNNRCIILIRENVFDTYLSILVARTSKIYHLTENTTQDKQDTITLETSNLIQNLNEIENDNQELLKIGKRFDHMVIRYSQLSGAEKNETLQEAVDFLSITEPVEFKTTLRKRNTSSLNALITNLDEVREILMSGKYRQLFIETLARSGGS